MSENKFSSLKEVRTAYQLLEEFKEFIIRRAEMWVAINRQSHRESLPELKVFRDSHEYKVWVTDIFSVVHQSKVETEILISWQKLKDSDSKEHTIAVPTKFIFSEGDDLEKDYATFLNLSSKFGIEIG